LSRKYSIESCEKIKNILLFVNYIKFRSQSFDCWIFCFESFFLQFHLLKLDLIWFLYQLWSLFFGCYLFFSYPFLNWKLLSIIFGPFFFLLLFIFFEIIYDIDFFSISPSFNFFICQIWSSFFKLLFILFEIIYDIRFFFQLHPPSIFFIYQIQFLFFLINLKKNINKLFSYLFFIT
jgi:hypothetical protein